uniref:Uncharacterized protein n=1 Tax=Knipowitschia caucasica TaxID=637954 RepID=A0AAV2LUS8_KNICA
MRLSCAKLRYILSVSSAQDFAGVSHLSALDIMNPHIAQASPQTQTCRLVHSPGLQLCPPAACAAECRCSPLAAGSMQSCRYDGSAHL